MKIGANHIPSLSLPQAALFLEITKILSDEANYVKYKVATVAGSKLLPYLLSAGKFYDALGRTIRAIVSIHGQADCDSADALTEQPIQNRSHPLLPASITLSLLPFKLYPAPPPPASKSAVSPSSPERASALVAFAAHVLTISLLTRRLAPKEITNLSKSLPFFELLSVLSLYFDRRDTEDLNADQAVHLLANLVAFGSARIASMDKGAIVSAWLKVTNALMSRLPLDAFKEERGKGKGKEIETIVLEDSDDEDQGFDAALQEEEDTEDVVMSDVHASTALQLAPLDPRTRSLLLSLSARPYTLTLLALSTRYPTSTRLPLTSYLCSLLAILPPPSKDSLLNTLLYAPTASGLLRELYRTFLRTGPLGKLLAQAKREKSTVVMAALRDEQYKDEWPVMALTLEMYSRCLLTMGDDEFYAETAGGPAGRGEGRNPLALDEVISLSAMARNTAFAMYWQEGSAPEVGTVVGEGQEKRVVGLRIGHEELRGLMTRFLQQVHARE